MKRALPLYFGAVLPLAFASAAVAQDSDPVQVNIDNFVHAQSDTNMAGYVKRGAFGKFLHERDMVDSKDGSSPE